MAYTEFYVQTTASNMNGGSDNADAAAYTSTNGNWSTSTNIFTPISGNPSASGVVVGQFASVYIDGATTPVYGARVTAVTTTTITLSATAKWGTAPITSATARSIKCGGAWKGPNAAVGFPFTLMADTATNAAGDLPRVNIKAGTNYAITTGITCAGSGSVCYEGYKTTIGDGQTSDPTDKSFKAVIDGGTSAIVLLSSTAGQILTCRNLIFQNNGTTGTSSGVISNIASTFERCVVNSVRGNGFDIGTTAGTILLECEAYACNQSNTGALAGFVINSPSILVRCISHDNTGGVNNGFYLTGINNHSVIDCIADTNGSTGFLVSSIPNVSFFGCIAYNNVGVGLGNASVTTTKILIENSLFISNGTWGIDLSGNTAGFVYGNNNAFYNNTSGDVRTGNKTYMERGKITLTAVPFVDAPNGDFRLKQGTPPRGAGRGAFTQTQASYGNASVLGYPDVGALQHLETAGGSYTFA